MILCMWALCVVPDPRNMPRSSSRQSARRLPKMNAAVCLLMLTLTASAQALLIPTAPTSAAFAHGYARGSAPLMKVAGEAIAKAPDGSVGSNKELKEPQMQPHHAIAIIAGTSIGGGFLALPSVAIPMGFVPAAVAMAAVTAVLALSAIAYAEAV